MASMNAPQPPEVQMVDAVGAADRDADSVNRDWVITCQIDEQFHGVRIGQEILWMDFEPADGGRVAATSARWGSLRPMPAGSVGARYAR